MTNQRRRRQAPVEEEPTGIILDKKFRLMPLDDENVSLQELVTVTTKAKGDEPEKKRKEWQHKSYHGKIPSAIKAYANIRCIRAKDRTELLSIIADIHDKIDNLFTFNPMQSGKTHNCKCKNQA